MAKLKNENAMPVNKNALVRYRILDKLLSDKYHSYTIDELMDHVNEELEDLGQSGVGRRMIEKDLKSIEEEFGAEIKSYNIASDNYTKKGTKKGKRYADANFRIFYKELTEDEEYLLNETLKLLGQFDGLEGFEELDFLRRTRRIGDDRKIVAFDKSPLSDKNTFPILFKAIANRQVIRVNYNTAFGKEDSQTLTVHPYMLKEYNRRWFLLCLDDKDDKIIILGLERIRDIEPLPSAIYKKPGNRLDHWFDDIIGVTRIDGNPVEHITFWVSDHSKDYVITKPLHHSQLRLDVEEAESLSQRYPDLPGGLFFTIDCAENYELIRELMSFGEDLVVISPEKIKTEIEEKISGMSRKYISVRTKGS